MASEDQPANEAASADEVVDFEPIEGETELTPPESYASALVEWAIDRHASDIFLSDAEKSVLISVRRLGRIEPVRRLARAYGHRLQGHFRVVAGSDAGEMRHPTEGRGVMVTPNGSTIDLRLSSVPTLFGQDVAIRLFDPASGARHLDKLGWDATELSEVESLLSLTSGLILVAGPVASGKSSTLYAALERLNDGTRKIHTLEDPIEYTLPGVMQSQINLKANLDFPELLAAVLRHSPDVIMVGEIRDARTAATAVRAGASGQLVLATIHAKTSAEAVDVMRQYGTNAKFLAGALIGVITQRLIRRLCPDCREAIDMAKTPSVPKRITRRLGETAPQLYQARGCPECYSQGFTSLTCLPEILTIDHDLSEAIANGAPAAKLHAMAARHGMLTLAEAAQLRVLRGDTTAAEAGRAVSDPELAALVSLSRR